MKLLFDVLMARRKQKGLRMSNFSFIGRDIRAMKGLKKFVSPWSQKGLGVLKYPFPPPPLSPLPFLVHRLSDTNRQRSVSCFRNF